jgi:hypothetical protein
MAAHSSPEAAKAHLDLQQRTLARLQSDFARLVYLASTRNYNTGRYEHDGLAFHYGPQVAEDVLAGAHREVFLNLARSSLRALTEELERYIVSESLAPDDLFMAWNGLEAYRILAPLGQDPLVVKIFQSNLKAALAIARESWKKAPVGSDQQYASQSPSLGQ